MRAWSTRNRSRRPGTSPRVDRVESIDPTVGITLKILGTVRASDQWEASGEFRRKLLTAFAENGIEIPGPRVALPEPDGAGVPAPGPTAEELVAGELKSDDGPQGPATWPDSHGRTLRRGRAASSGVDAGEVAATR